MTSRSFKPSSLTARPRRPQLGSRTSSASSMNSIRSADSHRDRSNPTTPIHQPAANAQSYFTASDLISRPTGTASLHPPSPLQRDSPRIGRSKPIAIELPPRRKSSAVETPPEPLSARGDLLGGYFPFHEDIVRSHKPHPFHNVESLSKPKPVPDAPLYTPHGHMDSMRQPLTSMSVLSSPSPMSMAIPMGKYHPSNYKNKTPTSSTPLAMTPPVQDAAAAHKRQSSDIKKKLQQYQRDMVEQAAVLGSLSGSGSQKPTSPRLLPLGSPGPVTPMELEENSGYLVKGRGDEGDAVSRLIVKEERRAVKKLAKMPAKS